MKNVLLLAVLALLCIPAPTVAAQSQLDVPTQLEYIDAQVDVFVPFLQSFQVNYYAQNGRYFQALTSHNTPPEGVAPPDDLNSAPTDETVALAALWAYAALPAATNFSFSVDTYDGPDGPGYVLNVETMINDEVWTRSINFGPEAWRGAEWFHPEPFNF